MPGPPIFVVCFSHLLVLHRCEFSGLFSWNVVHIIVCRGSIRFPITAYDVGLVAMCMILARGRARFWCIGQSIITAVVPGVTEG